MKPKSLHIIAMLVIMIGGAVLAAAAAAPVLYMSAQPLFGSSMPPFGRFFDRVLLLAVFGAFALLHSKIGLTGLHDAGLKPFSVKSFMRWAGIAIAASFALTGLLALGGFREPDAWRPAAEIASKLAKACAAAILVGIVEETFFRGIIFSKLRKSLRPWTAIVIVSAFYSTLHFIRPGAPIDTVTFSSGFTYVFQALSGFSLSGMYAEWTGLFLLGVLLARLYEKSFLVAACAGLHAGFVLAQRIDAIFLNKVSSPMDWLTGGDRTVAGLTAWAMLILLTWYVSKTK